MKDIIFLNHLSVQTIIGVLPFERYQKQKLIIDIQMETDLSMAGINDSLEHTISYAEVADLIESFSKTAKFQLLEAFAHQLIATLFEKFPIDAIILTVKKPGAIQQTQEVGITLSRKRPLA